MGEYGFRVDSSKNRLYVQLSGYFRDDEVAPMLDELSQQLILVRPGFDVVTDLSGFKPGNAGATEALRRGGELVKAKGRRRAVRVTGGLVVGLMQFKRILGSVFKEDNVRYAKSVAEADAILDEWESGA